jgi:hypothetical protein
MAGGAPGIINQDRADRRFERIANREFFEAVIAHQFVGSLLGQRGFRARIDRARGEKGFLHIPPATRFRMGMSTLLGDRRRPHQFGVEAGIDFGGRENQLLLLVSVNNRSRQRFAIPILENEPRFEIEAFGFGRRSRGGEDATENNSEEESNFSHGSAPYALDRRHAQTIF